MPSILAIFKGSKWLIRVQKKWGDLELQIRRDWEGTSKTVVLKNIWFDSSLELSRQSHLVLMRGCKLGFYLE